MLTAHDEAVSLFKGQEKACGRLGNSAIATTTALRLPPILAAYHAAQPDVDIQIKTGPTAELVRSCCLMGRWTVSAWPGGLSMAATTCSKRLASSLS